MVGSLGIDSGHRYLHRARLHCKGHALLGTNFQAADDGFPNVGLSFLLGISLTDAAWNSRTFGNPNAVLVTFQGDHEPHGGTIPHANCGVNTTPPVLSRRYCPFRDPRPDVDTLNHDRLKFLGPGPSARSRGVIPDCPDYWTHTPPHLASPRKRGEETNAVEERLATPSPHEMGNRGRRPRSPQGQRVGVRGWGEGKWSSQFGDLVSVAAGSRPNRDRYRCHHTRLPRSLDSYAPSPCLSPQAGRGNKCSRRAPCYPLATAECGIHTRLPRSLDSYAPSPCLSPQAGRGNKCGRRAPCYPLAP